MIDVKIWSNHGLRSSTLDHIFSLHALIEILKTRKQKLFCCFVDFSAAFDSVWRAGLWHKLLKSKINGKVLTVIRNMYNEIKSCVSLLGSDSSFFSSFSGVRQGENLSPVLFSMYLNDLEDYLMHDRSSGLEFETHDDEMFVYLRLIVLLYADDMVLLAGNESDLQRTLNEFDQYCKTWKLNVNIDKTKVVIFGARKTDSFHFNLGDKTIEITDKYKYLGIFFSQTRSFLTARKHIIEQARKAMYLLFCRIDNLNLPIDLQLKLFDHTVLPILTYACEIWSFEKLDMIEKVHVEFLRKITKSRKSTPLYALYAELGRHPLEINIKTRTIHFWNKIILGKVTKISHQLYQILRISNNSSFKWISNVKAILAHAGRNDLWINQNRIDTFSIKLVLKQIFLSQFIQNWHSDLTKSNKGKNYSIFKESIELEHYFTILPKHLYINMVRFRTGNHKLPVETGRWNNIEYRERKCLLCEKQSVGDELHYILECPYFKHERKLLIPLQFYSRPNTFKFHNLLNTRDEIILTNLGKFMAIIMKHFK